MANVAARSSRNFLHKENCSQYTYCKSMRSICQYAILTIAVLPYILHILANVVGFLVIHAFNHPSCTTYMLHTAKILRVVYQYAIPNIFTVCFVVYQGSTNTWQIGHCDIPCIQTLLVRNIQYILQKQCEQYVSMVLLK